MPSVLMHDLVFSNFLFDRVFATCFLCFSMVVCWCEQAHHANLFMERLTFVFDMVLLFVYSHAQNLAPGNKVSSVYFCTSTVGSLMKSVQESVIMEGSLSLLFMMMMV
jgi:hypothetical protein